MAEIKFEKALARLEEIVEELEKGDIEIEESLKIFEEGIKMTRLCSKKLEEAERKIEILTRDDQGRFQTRPFQGREK